MSCPHVCLACVPPRIFQTRPLYSNMHRALRHNTTYAPSSLIPREAGRALLFFRALQSIRYRHDRSESPLFRTFQKSMSQARHKKELWVRAPTSHTHADTHTFPSPLHTHSLSHDLKLCNTFSHERGGGRPFCRRVMRVPAMSLPGLAREWQGVST